MWRIPLISLLLLGSTIPALAARIDINDPALLGPVLVSIQVGDGDPYQNLITEVRYAAGTYSYVYAVQTSPYFPGTPHGDEEPTLLSVAVTGHPLGETWGSIGSPSFWTGSGGTTNGVQSMMVIDDGFIVIPHAGGSGSWTVFYSQSPLGPALNGTLIYTAKDYCSSFYPDCTDENGEPVYFYGSKELTVFAPVPEPGSIALLGSGLVGLYATLRRHRAAKV
jgi:hypothetical protein